MEKGELKKRVGKGEGKGMSRKGKLKGGNGSPKKGGKGPLYMYCNVQYKYIDGINKYKIIVLFFMMVNCELVNIYIR